MSRSLVLSLFAIGLAGWVVPGCITEAYRTVEVAHGVQYDDIPVPQDFKLSHESWDYQGFPSGGPVAFRSAVLVYWGDRPISELINWYEEQMVVAGWTHENTFEEGPVRLTFTKNNEAAELRLERLVAADREGHITKITVDIGVK